MTDSPLPTTRRTILASTATLAVGTTTAGAANKSNSSSASGNETNNSQPPVEEPDEIEESTTEVMDATRFTHLSPDVGSVNIYVNGTQEWPTAKKLHASEYYPHTAETTYTITVTPAEGDDPDPLIETDVTLGTGAHTLALVGERCSVSNHPLDLVTIKDDYSGIKADKARIQYIHASTDAPAVDILRKDGTLMLGGLEFGTADTVDIPADGEAQTILVTEAGTTNQLSKFAIEPAPGQAHTGYILGYTDPANAPSSVPDAVLKQLSDVVLGFGPSEPPTK